MDMFLITETYTLCNTLEEAKDVLRERYKGDNEGRPADLNFEERGIDTGVWDAYNFSAMGWDKDVAPTLPETIRRVEAPPMTGALDCNPFDTSVTMEFRITTRDTKVSVQNQMGLAWEGVGALGRAHFIEQFANRAGQALADQLTKGVKP